MILTTIIVFIIILGFLVLVHELGHFLTARAFKIGVEEFGLGFPPRVWSKVKNGVRYSLNLIPLGGFVKIKGEDGEALAPDSFGAKPAWQRTIVLCAGVFMNILAGWLILVGLFVAGAPTVIADNMPEKYIHNRQLAISSVLPDSPAAAAALQTGDIILSVDGEAVDTVEKFRAQTAAGVGERKIEFKRGRQILETAALARVITETGLSEPVVGVVLDEVGTVRLPPIQAIAAGSVSTYNYLKAIVLALGGVVKNAVTGQGVSDDLGGPVALAVTTNDVLDLGPGFVLLFTAVLSFNLAIINILPFPALDGGRLIFVIVEKIRGRASRADVEAWFHRTGFALLLLLAVVVTYNDIIRFGGRIWKALVG